MARGAVSAARMITSLIPRFKVYETISIRSRAFGRYLGVEERSEFSDQDN